MATVLSVTPFSSADRPDEHSEPDPEGGAGLAPDGGAEPARPDLQLVGPPAPVDRRRRISTALLALGVVLILVAVLLAL
jgi:hypothetical protein